MKKTLLDKEEMRGIVNELAERVRTKHPACESMMLVGIERRGADLARRINESLGGKLPLGTLDINLYRDDWTKLDGKPHIGPSMIPDSLDGKTVILVDDVIFTGRTIRSALDALLDYGRPRKVELLALIDRGHRELPIQPDYSGKVLTTKRSENINVLLEERDGQDAVILEQIVNEATTDNSVIKMFF